MITLRPSSSGPGSAFWIDLFEPDDDDKAQVETGCGLTLPSRADLQEIESSSRHYTHGGRIFLSTPFVTREADSDDTLITPVGFILDPDRVITQRFGHANLFGRLGQSLDGRTDINGGEAFCILVEAMVDHQADQLEAIGLELDTLSRRIFRRSGMMAPSGRDKADDQTGSLTDALSGVGRLGERIGQLRASLLGMGRITPYVCETARSWLTDDQLARLSVARQDLTSLTDFEGHLANKVQFLLDAILGFISIDQNNVVKILTIVSVVGVPPVLIAGVYGMNFKAMPELDWKYGYAYALALMLATTIAPLVWFRLKKWF